MWGASNEKTTLKPWESEIELIWKQLFGCQKHLLFQQKNQN